MMALQQNFKRVLLNCAPSSIHLHQAHLKLHPTLRNTLNVIRTKISHIIRQFSRIWVEKLKAVHFDRKLALMVFGSANYKSGLSFFIKFRPQNPIFEQMFCVKIGTLGIWRMLILIPTLVSRICNPESIFGQTWSRRVKAV